LMSRPPTPSQAKQGGQGITTRQGNNTRREEGGEGGTASNTGIKEAQGGQNEGGGKLKLGGQ